MLPIYAAITTDGEVTEIKTQSKEIEITSNGTADITPDAGFAYLNSVKVKTNVAGGAGPKELKRDDVNFFDYDGTLLYSYSWEEAKNLTVLPAAPSHDGMTFSEWNYTLNDIKAQGTDTIKGKADVGACYVDERENGVANPENVLIIPRGNERMLETDCYRGKLISVLSIPNTIISMEPEVFVGCTFLNTIVIPTRCEMYGDYYGSFSAGIYRNIWLNGKESFVGGFAGYFADKIEFQSGLVEIGENAMANSNFGFVKLPDTIETLRYGSFYTIAGSPVCAFDFSSAKFIPVCEEKVFNSERLYIIVPDSLLNEWKSATNWSEYSDNIYAASTFNFNAI